MKRIFTGFLILALVLTTACREKESTPKIDAQVNTTETEEQKLTPIQFPLNIKVGYSTGSDDPRGVALQLFKEKVEKETKGDITIEIHSNGELGSDGELIAGLIDGSVDMTVSSAGNYALYATRIGVSALPFLFADFESAWRFIDSETIQNINKDLEEYNIHVLAYFDNGFRCVTTSEEIGAVMSADDMEGLNIRTPDNQIVMETMSELGARPKSYPFASLKDALKDGTFDAQENPIPVIYNNKLYEVQKYLSVTNHSYDAMPLAIREDIWQQLPENYQQIIKDAAAQAQQKNREIVKKGTEEYVELLEKEGMKIVYPDLEPFKEKTMGVMNVFSGLYDDELIRFVRNYK